jgi:TctA family transporter
VAAVALCGGLGIALLLALSRWVARFIDRVPQRWVGMGVLIVLLIFVGGIGGWGGLLVCLSAAGIGLMPSVFHCRRSQCIGVLLVPLLLDMAGLGSGIATWMGLI